MESFAFERHYRVKELAGLWGLSAKTVSRIFAEEAGVIRVTNDGTSKRKYATLSIPESVASRVHEKLGNQQLSESLQAIQQVRIIRLGNIDSAVSGKGRNIIRLKRPSR
jgi:AraC-like DNA-binding protein